MSGVYDLWRRRDGTPSARDGQGLRYRVRVEGYPATSHRTRVEAEAVLRERLVAGPPRQASSVTVGELLDRWLLTKRGLSRAGYQACHYAAQQVRAEWGTVPVQQVERSQVRAWLAGLQSQDLRAPRVDECGRKLPAALVPAANSTRAKALQALSGAMQIAVERRLIDANPTRGVKVGAQARRDVEPLEPELLRRLAEAESDYEGFVWFLALAGTRPGEAAALNVRDIDAKRRRARVRRSKTGKARDVPLTSFLLSKLDLGRPSDEPLFLNSGGGRLNVASWRRWAWDRARRAIGRPDMVPYELRHTCASMLIASGADVRQVAAVLGHSPRMTLEVYAHLFEGHLGDVSARMERLVADDFS